MNRRDSATGTATSGFSHLYVHPVCTSCGARNHPNPINPPTPTIRRPMLKRRRNRFKPSLPTVVEDEEEPPSSNATSWESLAYPPQTPAKKKSSDSPHAQGQRKISYLLNDMAYMWERFVEEVVNHKVESRKTKAEKVELVNVEQKGEGLILHILCPCGSEFHILLLGGSAYYRLA